MHFVSYTVNPCDVTIHVLKKKNKKAENANVKTLLGFVEPNFV